MEYRRDIDGLRAVAVLAVVFFHAHFGYVAGGFVGVDVFFVISGYLITSIIQQEITERRFSLVRFYERRIRRIMPALLGTVALTWLAASILYMPPEFKDVSATTAASSFFATNFVLWRQTAYFGTPAEIKPLLHLWSLAVEEQFYLLFPMALLLLNRFGQRAMFLAICGIFLLSLGLSIWITARAPAAAFYLPITRAWELMLGAALAFEFLAPSPYARFNEIGSAIGLGLILCAAFLFSSQTRFPGFAAIIPCAGTALVIQSGKTGSTAVSRVLGAQPFVFVGLISYSLYLIHWPVLAIARYYAISELSTAATMVALALSMAAAIVSWKFLERPFRSRHSFISRRQLFVTAACASALVFAAGAAGYASNGIPGRYPGYAHLDYRDRIPAYNEGTCFFLDEQPAANWSATRCRLSAGQEGLALLWGDSFAAHYAPGIEADSGNIHGAILQYSVASCAPFVHGQSSWRGDCGAYAREALAIIKENNIRTVILSANWEEERQHYEAFFDDLRATVKTLKDMGVDVVVMGQSPVFTFWDSLGVAYRLKITDRSTSNYHRFLKFEPGFNATLQKELPNTHVIDPMDGMCSPQRCPIILDKQPLYIDGGHYSVLGSTLAVENVADQLNAALDSRN